MLLTVPIREVVEATPRARIVRLDLRRSRVRLRRGQAVLICAARRPATACRILIASAPEDARRERMLELLVGADPTESPSSPSSSRSLARSWTSRGLWAPSRFPVDRTSGASLHRRRHRHRTAARDAAPRARWCRIDSIGVFYSARTPDDFAYENERLRALADRGRIDLRQTITRSTAGGLDRRPRTL